ncbi:hypothetical protein Bca4012_009406 [Brassica carinata]|uniref:Uncharacterized protein n=1 Tax=Brassica carinata TaxID=52824 RepID=A0A8X7V115_BRACI|nr:hypothetical protein Bca52824_034671 [Brassica carinata]
MEEDQYSSFRCCRHDFKPPSLQMKLVGRNIALSGMKRKLELLLQKKVMFGGAVVKKIGGERDVVVVVFTSHGLMLEEEDR